MAGWLESLGEFARAGQQSLDRFQVLREMEDNKQWERRMREMKEAQFGWEQESHRQDMELNNRRLAQLDDALLNQRRQQFQSTLVPGQRVDDNTWQKIQQFGLEGLTSERQIAPTMGGLNMTGMPTIGGNDLGNLQAGTAQPTTERRYGGSFDQQMRLDEMDYKRMMDDIKMQSLLNVDPRNPQSLALASALGGLDVQNAFGNDFGKAPQGQFGGTGFLSGALNRAAQEKGEPLSLDEIVSITSRLSQAQNRGGQTAGGGGKAAGGKALADAVIANPGIYAQLTPTARTEIAPLLNAAGFDFNAGLKGTGKPPTGQQARALNFFNRAYGATKELEDMGDWITNMSSTEQFALNLPDWANAVKSKELQAYLAAQRAFTEARLRKDSGAAIPTHEISGDRKTYFQMFGDQGETQEMKRRMRAQLLQSLAYEAGPALVDFYGADEAQRMMDEFKSIAGGAQVNDTVMVLTPKGDTVAVPKKDLQAALAAGGKVVTGGKK